MSYLPFRDNPDLAGVGEITREALSRLGDSIDVSSRIGLHNESCGCNRGTSCPWWPSTHTANGEETLGWLVGQGLLDANAVVRWLAESR